MDEHSATNDPQSNGWAEQTVGAVKSKAMSIIAGLEQKMKKRIPLNHPIAGWAVEHAADCMNRYLISSDGQTVIKRLRGTNPDSLWLNLEKL